MVTRLAQGTVADVDEPWGEELVTLLAPVEGPLRPHQVGGAGHGALRRWERRKPLGPHARLRVVVDTTERGGPWGARGGDRAERAGPRGPRRSDVAPTHRA